MTRRERPRRASSRLALLIATALLAGVAGFAGSVPVAAQADSVTLRGTVTAEGGASLSDVVVTVMDRCWYSCRNDGRQIPDDGPARPRPLDPSVFLGETSPDAAGNWSVTVDGPFEGQPIVLAWDRSAMLAIAWTSPHPWSWDPELWSAPNLEFRLEAGGQISGRLTGPAGAPVPAGQYALVQGDDTFSSRHPVLALDVDPQTGQFTSPAVTPGEYRIAHGHLHGDFLANNDAARVQAIAGQTASAGAIQVQLMKPGTISGHIADKSGLSLSGARIQGGISSQGSYGQSYSPFSVNGSTSFWTTTGEDGTFTAHNLIPHDNWNVTFSIPVPRQYAALSTGLHHSCAIAADQTIDCWGLIGSGESDVPDGQYTAVSAGTSHTCAIATDNTIDCWGNNGSGKSDAPDGQYTAISSRNVHSCAIATDNTIDCWGSDFYGESDAPDGQYTAVSAGASHTCAIGIDQTIECWGSNYDGESDAPGGQYTAISSSTFRTCAIGIDQTIDCWGRNYDGESDAPDGQYTAIAAGDSHTCAIAADQTIDCWGRDLYGETDAPDGQYTAISAGAFHSCAIGTDQTIECWGWSRYGQTRPPDAPIQELSLEGVDLASGGSVVCSVDWNGTAEAMCSDSQTETDPEEEDGAADRCFAVHKFGAQPVDVAKSVDRQTVLAQLNWGFHESIGCYLTLDEAALGVLQAAPAPLGFPAADPAASQQCFEAHKFGAQPVDVAKSADRQTVLAQVRWGFHQSIGCFLTLDDDATAALRAAHT